VGSTDFFLVKEYPQHGWEFQKALAMPRINYPSEARNNYTNQKKDYLTSLGILKKRYPTAISIAAGHLTQAKDNSMSL